MGPATMSAGWSVDGFAFSWMGGLPTTPTAPTISAMIDTPEAVATALSKLEQAVSL